MVSSPAPLQCEQQRDNSRHEEERSWEIEFRQLLFNAGTSFDWIRGLEEKQGEKSRDAADGQVDIETPSP